MNLEISSKQNPQYKELKKLVNDRKANSIVIEGKKLLLEASGSSLKFEKFYIDKKNNNFILNLFPSLKQEQVTYITNELLASLYSTESEPTGEDLVIAVASRPSYSLNEVLKLRKNIIFLEKVQDPGNIGVIIRSSLAFNAGGVFLYSGCADPFSTKVIRASAGAVFKIPVLEVDSLEQFKKIAKENKFNVVATSSKEGKSLSELNQLSKSPSVFLFGNEGKGLSRELLESSDSVVAIPHLKEVESLNVGIAVSVLLWSLYNKK